MQFAVVDPYLERNIVSPKETELKGKDMVEWGDRNAYPDYLRLLYMSCPTLKTVINGTVDFITGDGMELKAGERYASGMNKRGDTIREQVGLANYLVLESNHDVNMLSMGKYSA